MQGCGLDGDLNGEALMKVELHPELQTNSIIQHSRLFQDNPCDIYETSFQVTYNENENQTPGPFQTFSLTNPNSRCRICQERRLVCTHKPCQECRRRKIRCKHREAEAEEELRAKNGGELPPVIDVVDFSRKKKGDNETPARKKRKTNSMLFGASIEMSSKEARQCRVCRILEQPCAHQPCGQCSQRRVRCKHIEAQAKSELEPDQLDYVTLNLEDLDEKESKAVCTIGFAEGRGCQHQLTTATTALIQLLLKKDDTFVKISENSDSTTLQMTEGERLTGWLNGKLQRCGTQAENEIMRCYFLGCSIPEKTHYDISAAIYDLLELIGVYSGFAPGTISTKFYMVVIHYLVLAAFFEEDEEIAYDILRECCSNVTLIGKSPKTFLEIQDAGQYWRLANVSVVCSKHPRPEKEWLKDARSSTKKRRPSSSYVSQLGLQELFAMCRVLEGEKKMQLFCDLGRSLAIMHGAEKVQEALNSAIETVDNFEVFGNCESDELSGVENTEGITI